MKAVILPTGKSNILSPLDNLTPDFLLPVVNKPLVEHLIELLLAHNIRDIILVLRHMPWETEQYFRKGERWGCSISYSLEREYEGVLPALEKINSRVTDSFICLPGNIITNLNISSLIDEHEKTGADMTIPAIEKWQYRDDAMESYPFIINPRTLHPFLSTFSHSWNLSRIIQEISSREGLSIHISENSFSYYTIGGIEDYVEINRKVLNNQIHGINIPGRQIRDKIWIGRHTNINSGVKLVPPLLIGSNCNIRNLSSIGMETIIGNSVIVDSDAEIKRSIIFDNTYIGAHTEVKDSIVRENSILNLKRMLKLYVSDDFILGSLEKKTFTEKTARFLNTSLALLLFLLLSPLIMAGLLFHVMFPKKHYLYREKRFGKYEVNNTTGELNPFEINHYFFNSRFHLIRKLPGLINVIKGDLFLAGNSTLTEEEVSSLTEEWEKIRFHGPSGLFHSWEVEQSGEISWEEKIIAENYYTSTRNFYCDLIILFKSLMPSKKAICRPTNHIFPAPP